MEDLLKDEQDTNWVLRRHSCSVEGIFDCLVRRFRKDVGIMNKELSSNNTSDSFNGQVAARVLQFYSCVNQRNQKMEVPRATASECTADLTPNQEATTQIHRPSAGTSADASRPCHVSQPQPLQAYHERSFAPGTTDTLTLSHSTSGDYPGHPARASTGPRYRRQLYPQKRHPHLWS